MINVNTIFLGYTNNPMSFVQFRDSQQRPAPIELKHNDLVGLKEELSAYDLKNISQPELGELGRKLFDHGLINDTVFALMGLGDPEYDEQGRQINRNRKFDALEFFDKRQSITSSPEFAWAGSGPGSGLDGYKQINQVLRVLSFFTNSDQAELGLYVKV